MWSVKLVPNPGFARISDRRSGATGFDVSVVENSSAGAVGVMAVLLGN